MKVKQLYKSEFKKKKSEFQLKDHQKPQMRGVGVPFLPTPKRMGLNSLSHNPDAGTKFPHPPVSGLKRER